MRTDRFIKLVRDGVGGENDAAVYRLFSSIPDDFHWALKRKLIEEALEYQDGGEIDELIDAFEVIWTLVNEIHKINFEEFRGMAERRRVERGSFRNRLSLWIRRGD